jgi:hypothetical protein
LARRRRVASNNSSTSSTRTHQQPERRGAGPTLPLGTLAATELRPLQPPAGRPCTEPRGGLRHSAWPGAIVWMQDYGPVRSNDARRSPRARAQDAPRRRSEGRACQACNHRCLACEWRECVPTSLTRPKAAALSRPGDDVHVRRAHNLLRSCFHYRLNCPRAQPAPLGCMHLTTWTGIRMLANAALRRSLCN